MSSWMAPDGDRTTRLRELIEGPDLILAPGAYDALSARLVEETGFSVVYMTGFGTAAGRIGRPDVGLLTLTEMADQARRLVDAVRIPVIADGDTGYGNPLNVIRTVKEYERAGVSGIQLEDQVIPKKCGHMSGKAVISVSEMVAKLQAAVDARTQNTVIIARTDALAVEGLNAAIERAARYYEAGADMLFIEAPEHTDQIRRLAFSFPEVPLVFNWAEGGKTPPLSRKEIVEMGFKLVIFPLSTLFSATAAMRQVLQVIYRSGTPAVVMDQLVRFDEFLRFIGLPEIHELEQRYRS
ncbi:Carboxyvinyl-carboxyphosphonate phosphorylmutase [Sulfobacillus acidophilus DSM 10332]|uniref:2-methylisocitrate lyase n=1 Tax=Sulfobacillus acidophilus (strain ATCC 700253 / DSM 10332 / NAL) TaxID=679936 RepID=G8TTG8_SULAD|nr:Carboxyvinyl-carboxyphosphonate phosphorylmutase [Sulfobacillus acidophilus DSM 10332]